MDYLKPHDTIHAIVRSGTDFHGIVELTFAHPTDSRPAADSFVVTGANGWLSINQVNQPDGKPPIIRITITSIVKVDGEPDFETVEVIEEPMRGVASEVSYFFGAIKGGGEEVGGGTLGDPLGALFDVAVIQAALNSHGEPVDLGALVPHHFWIFGLLLTPFFLSLG